MPIIDYELSQTLSQEEQEQLMKELYELKTNES
jgi:hypothetical protein